MNRFYTQECFLEVKKILTNDGVFAFTLNVPVNYLSEEAKGLTASINTTIKRAFPNILVLPEETSILFLASQAPFPSQEKLAAYNIQTQYFTSQYLSYRLSNNHISQLEKLFAETQTKVNTDFHPAAYFYQTAFWQTTQNFQLAKILKGMEKISWLLLVVPALLILFLLKKKVASPIMSMGIASFTLMTIEILIIFLFQSQLGYLYSKIALIFTTILISMGVGNLIGTKIKDTKNGLLLMKLLIFLYLLLFLPIIKNFSFEPIFYLLGGIIGVLVGTVFPLTNKAYLKKKEKIGVLYSSDLFGAFFGAILPSLFFIPLFGTQKTIILLIVFNLLLI